MQATRTRLTVNDRSEIATFVINAPEGQNIIYYEGFLGFDRKADTNKAILANEIYSLYLDGYVELVQKKIEQSIFSKERYKYIAIKMPKEGQDKRAKRNRNLYNSLREPYKGY